MPSTNSTMPLSVLEIIVDLDVLTIAATYPSLSKPQRIDTPYALIALDASAYCSPCAKVELGIDQSGDHVGL